MLRLRKLRIKNPNKVIIAHLNINLIRNKFEMLSLLFHGVIDILMICKTKTDGSFPAGQFIIEGYSTIFRLHRNNIEGYSTIFRLDRNDRGGGIMLIVKDNFLTSHFDKYCFPDQIEIFCIELNLRKKKWLIFSCYNPHKHLLKHYLFQIEYAIKFYSKA